MTWMKSRCDTPGCRARSRTTIQVGLARVILDSDGMRRDPPVIVDQRFCWKHAFTQACEHLRRAAEGDVPSSVVVVTR